MKTIKLKLTIVMLSTLALWVCMVGTDYVLSKRVQTPIFALKMNTNDADIYHGLGYTIVIDDGYAIAPPGAEMKGYFHWGWH